jgi:hypothetical protein
MRETASVAGQIAIVVWMASVANGFIWWQLQDQLLTAVRRDRLGERGGAFVGFLRALGRPQAIGSTASRHLNSKFDRVFTPSDDAVVEMQRRKTLMAAGIAAGFPLLGLIAAAYAVEFVKMMFPGTLIVWACATMLVAMTAWVVFWTRSPRIPARTAPGRAAAIAGVAVNALSLVAIAATWLTGWTVL